MALIFEWAYDLLSDVLIWLIQDLYLFGMQYYYDWNHAPQNPNHGLKLEQLSEIQLFFHTFECWFLQNKISLVALCV